MIVKNMKKLDKWNATLTLVASTVDEYSSTKKLITCDFTITIYIDFLLVRASPKTQEYIRMEMKSMENRSRNNQLKIYLSEEEKELFDKKMKLARCKTMSLFIRKCVMEKEIYIVDLKPFIELQSSLEIANNNINQIARRVNKTGVIYKTDIKKIKNDIAKISKEQWDIHSLLLKRTRKLNK